MEHPELALLFFDHSDKIEHYREAIGEAERHLNGVTVQPYFVKSDVRELVKDFDINCIVSPANCLGFMDGGIDMLYMQMFPGIQTTVENRIKTFDITTPLGGYALPIGSAMLVKTGNDQCPLLACVPTMFLPGNIAGTRNVYWAVRGLLRLVTESFFPEGARHRVVVAVPCLGTGVGNMTGQASGQQVAEALRDVCLGSELVAQNEEVELWKDANNNRPKHAYVLTGLACPQPEDYANAEIQKVDAKEIQVRVE
jgi:O-acetyl-ADP-ribose deacetylase (regulator of RNase III)